MKIAIILSIGLPIPAICGGAIEQLITTIIDQNEKHDNEPLYVYSPYSSEIEKEKRNYVYTHIFYHKCAQTSTAAGKPKSDSEMIGDRITAIFRWVKEIQPDLIVMEEGDYQSIQPIAEYFGRERMILHLHHDYYPYKTVEDSFGTVITVSEYAKRTYLSTMTDGNTNVEIVRNCINEECFKKRISESERVLLRKQLGFTEDDFVVIFCGRIIIEKGILELVRAVKNIELSDVKLLVIGSVNFKTNDTSYYYERVMREIREAQERICYRGYVDNWDLYKYYQIADIQVIPSLCEEAAGLVAIEGMTSGLPLIVTDSGGLVEYVNEECACIVKRDAHMLAELKRQIIDLYGNNEKRNKMRTASLNRAQRYSQENYYRDFMRVCENAALKVNGDRNGTKNKRIL